MTDAQPRLVLDPDSPTMLGPGSLIVLYLAQPSEKYWGVLYSLDSAGVILRGLHLSSFEEWMMSIVREDEQFVSLSTSFFPLLRVERVALDEEVGGIECLHQRFVRMTGRDVGEFLS